MKRVIDEASEKWRDRLNLCVKAKGKYFGRRLRLFVTFYLRSPMTLRPIIINFTIGIKDPKDYLFLNPRLKSTRG